MYRIKSYLTVIFLLAVLFSSCRLFDKEIIQDEHIASFRMKLDHVEDSLNNHKERVNAYENILIQINEDDRLITKRKKNNLEIEANKFLYKEYLSVKNYSSALRLSEIILSLDSTAAEGYYNRGCIYQIKGKDSLALKDYDYAIRLNENYPEAYYNRGLVYEKSKKYDLALLDYTNSINLKPLFLADIYNNRGNIYMEKENTEEAIDDYNSAIELDSTNIKVYSNRAWAYINAEEYDLAMADCNKILSLDPNNVNAYIRQAMIYEHIGNYKEAIQSYKLVLKLDPNDKLDTEDIARKAILRLKKRIK